MADDCDESNDSNGVDDDGSNDITMTFISSGLDDPKSLLFIVERMNRLSRRGAGAIAGPQ